MKSLVALSGYVSSYWHGQNPETCIHHNRWSIGKTVETVFRFPDAFDARLKSWAMFSWIVEAFDPRLKS